MARVRAHAGGDGEPSPRLYQQALRDVIGRCLYGVDVNPMAAELCRVSLWLEALEPGKPLSFLDHHIRVGDSLLGATQDLVAAGLPDKAFERIQGDDKAVSSALRKRNRVERESGQQDMARLMVAETRPEYGSLASLSRGVDESPDGTLHDVRRKATRFRSLVVSPQYRHEQRVADVWCGAFVWPKRAGDDPSCITTDTGEGPAFRARCSGARATPESRAVGEPVSVLPLASRVPGLVSTDIGKEPLPMVLEVEEADQRLGCDDSLEEELGSGVQPASATADFAFFARAVQDVETNDRRFTLSAGDIGLLNPNTHNCPIFRTRRDAVLGKAIYRRVHVLVRESENGPDPIGNPWNVRFSTMFHMANDSGLFRSRTELEAEGWRLSGNVFCRNGEEHLPLYEGKMVHQFDHRWGTWEDGERRDLTVLEKQSRASTVLPRHWVQAREVYLRIAELPRGLLAALRNRDLAAILFCVAHLLFAHWLRRAFGESADRASREIFPEWMAFVAHHPFARAVPMAGMVSSLGDASARIQPLDRSCVPALPLDELSADEFDIDELSRVSMYSNSPGL